MRSPRFAVSLVLLAYVSAALATTDPKPTSLRLGITPIRPAGPFLGYGRFFSSGPREMIMNPALKALDGARVRVVGFMVEMEMPPTGSFYLVSHPQNAAEDGGGTGDLPPSAIQVVVRSAVDKVIGFMPGPIIATGTLRVGPRVDPDGRVSFVSLILDRPDDLSPETLTAGHSRDTASSTSPHKEFSSHARLSPLDARGRGNGLGAGVRRRPSGPVHPNHSAKRSSLPRRSAI